MTVITANWNSRRTDPFVLSAVAVLKEKFQSVDHHGPQQLAIFHNSTDAVESAMHARRAFELVRRLLSLL
jgi:hypothetical protein